MKKHVYIFILLCGGILSLFVPLCDAQVIPAIPDQLTLPLPNLNISIGQTDDPKEFTTTLQLLFLLTILSLAPSFLIMMTSFTRIIIVLSFLRQGLATPQMPSNQILAGLALFLTFFVMAPVWQEVNDQAIQPYLANELPQQEAFQNALKPIREFLFQQTRTRDLQLMQNLAKLEKVETKADTPTHVLIPAFIISELTTAFTIGFVLFIPFLVIDMVVASILMAMGMMMLPPITISLPFKVLLFVLIDGWGLLVHSLVVGFQRGG
ncbi:MAG: flagellar type III secretion system pore protein FliP [Candidatus Poribacteria bacterium]|nr:flagellar type III secretion system pore protein FliP [Candidatus Poribacteria bacterium]